MGVFCNYECISAKVRSELGTFAGKRLVLCDLQFRNEHGHKLAPVEGALVAIENHTAKLAKYTEDILPSDAGDEDWSIVSCLCDNHAWLDYDIDDNGTKLYRLLQA